MPHDSISHVMQPHENSLIAVVASSLVAMLAAALSAVQPIVSDAAVTVQEVARALTVMDDDRMRMVCLAGSIGGALLSILLFMGDAPKARPMIAKLFASGIAGMIFSPMAIKWANLSVDTDTLLFVSGVVALMSYSVLQKAVPLFNKLGEKWLVSRTMDTSPYDVEGNRSRAAKAENKDRTD
jgi:hypothetical protein